MNRAATIALAAVTAVSALCFAPLPCFAQRADPFALDNRALFPSYPGLFSSGLVSSSAAFGWTIPGDPLPPSSSIATRTAARPPSANVGDRLTDWLPKPDYATGEVGFLYGRATGKYGGDFKQAYIIGGVGDEKLHIIVGAAYEDTNFRFPRYSR
jgi:hypothetical protein